MNKNPKIAFVIPFIASGGAERVQCILANIWADKGYQVVVICLCKEEPFYELSKNIQYIPFDIYPLKPQSSAIINFLKGIYTIRKVLKNQKPDYVISFLTINNLQVLISAYRIKTMKIISERSNPLMDTKMLRKWQVLRNLLYRQADLLILQTKESKQIWNSLQLKLPKIAVINNVISKEFSADSFCKKEKYILTVGRFTCEKRHIDLIEMFAKIKTDWKLLIIGDGELRKEYEDKIKKLNINDRVILLGQVKKPQQYYKKAAIYVHVSAFEGFPNALCEAMISGCASISFNISTGPKEIIEHNKNGILIDDNDFQSLQKSVVRCIKDISFRKKLSENASLLSTRLNPQTIIQQWEDAMSIRPI